MYSCVEESSVHLHWNRVTISLGPGIRSINWLERKFNKHLNSSDTQWYHLYKAWRSETAFIVKGKNKDNLQPTGVFLGRY